ncbi:kinase-like protein [Melanomma pulvis-pyrius CBS 109.77]|uniref:Kinase-like protein n=1 Tax=Melanomma pulvis-pyrius CBS 109.77 TaxID=1314802 RepID=A0A6A6WT15_9PLEO|nr:kinase-like protein [Melanomma pulvis-pyrius CBS 109.77]
MTAATRQHFQVPLLADSYAEDGTPLFKKWIGNPHVIRTPYSPSPIDRYRREADLLSQCSHNHIVRIKGFHNSELDTEIRLDLELAPYGSVLRFNASGPEKMSTFPHRLEQLIQIVDALDYLHTTARMVHASVHLSHMLVFRREDDVDYPSGLVKLCSFGGAFKVGETGQPMTPLDCRPPESFTNEDRFPEAYRSFATITMLPCYDIYSIGRFILRRLFKIDPEAPIRAMAGGKATEEDYRAAFRTHTQGIRDGSYIEEATETLPDWWKDVVRSCCTIDPAKRLSAQELKTKLIQEGRQQALP